MVLYVGQGDPEASMRLLWGDLVDGAASTDSPTTEKRPGKRGPKAAISLDEIVRTAIEMADAGGIDAVSMRAVGDRLGRTPMALYTYVPSKAELIDLMYDRVFDELPTDYRQGGDSPGGNGDGNNSADDAEPDWRPGVRRWAMHSWSFHLRHPWLLDVSGARPNLGPNDFRQLEAAALLFAPTGMSGRDIMRSVGIVSRFVHGSARTVAETRKAESETGVDENDWWYKRNGLLTDLVPDFAERFPYLTELEQQGTFDAVDETAPYLESEAEDIFRFGLARLLDGIQAYIDQSVASSTQE